MTGNADSVEKILLWVHQTHREKIDVLRREEARLEMSCELLQQLIAQQHHHQKESAAVKENRGTANKAPSSPHESRKRPRNDSESHSPPLLVGGRAERVRTEEMGNYVQPNHSDDGAGQEDQDVNCTPTDVQEEIALLFGGKSVAVMSAAPQLSSSRCADTNERSSPTTSSTSKRSSGNPPLPSEVSTQKSRVARVTKEKHPKALFGPLSRREMPEVDADADDVIVVDNKCVGASARKEEEFHPPQTPDAFWDLKLSSQLR